MFDTNMNNEYKTLHDELGFTVADLFQLSLNAVGSSFLREDKKRSLRESFRKEFERDIE